MPATRPFMVCMSVCYSLHVCSEQVNENVCFGLFLSRSLCLARSSSNRMLLIIIMAFGASLTQLSHLPYPKQFHCQQIRFKLCDFAIVNIAPKRNSMVSFYGVHCRQRSNQVYQLPNQYMCFTLVKQVDV